MGESDYGIGFLFDWDGVVVDSSAQHEESWELLAEQEGLPLFEGHFKLGFGKRNALIIEQFLKWSSDPSEINRLGDKKERLYREILQRTGLKPLPGVQDFLASLVQGAYPFAVGSSTPRQNIDAVVKLTGLDGIFKQLVTAEDVSQGKPHPEVFLKGAGLIGVAPERCVVFEDSFSGIEAGLAGGMKVVALATTNLREELEKMSVSYVADSFEEITIERMIALFD